MTELMAFSELVAVNFSSFFSTLRLALELGSGRLGSGTGFGGIFDS